MIDWLLINDWLIAMNIGFDGLLMTGQYISLLYMNKALAKQSVILQGWQTGSVILVLAKPKLQPKNQYWIKTQLDVFPYLKTRGLCVLLHLKLPLV